MILENEPYRPTSQTLGFVEKCIGDIRPDVPELVQWHDLYVVHHKNRIALDYELVKNNISPHGKILEVGSSPPLLTSVLVKGGFGVEGIDISPERYASTFSKLNVPVAKCDVETETLPYASNSFGAVLFFEIFEHLRINPVKTLSEIMRVIKPGGRLLLSTPNLRSWGGILNFLKKNCAYSCSGPSVYEEYKSIETLGHMGHVREYTSVEVTDFLERTGFKMEKLIFRGEYDTRKRKIIIRMFHSLRPFITYAAKKVS